VAKQKRIEFGINIVKMVEKNENEDEQEDGFYLFSPKHHWSQRSWRCLFQKAKAGGIRGARSNKEKDRLSDKLSIHQNRE
jgi:hypothetical protein